MTPSEKIAENKQKARAWLQSAHARHDQKIEDASRRQREMLNKRRKHHEQAN